MCWVVVVVIDGAISSSDVHLLFVLLGVLLLVIFGGCVFDLLSVYFGAVVERRFSFGVVYDVFSRLEKASARSLDSKSVGSIISTVEADVTGVSDLVFSVFNDLGQNLCLLVYFGAIAVSLDWRIFLVVS